MQPPFKRLTDSFEMRSTEMVPAALKRLLLLLCARSSSYNKFNFDFICRLVAAQLHRAEARPAAVSFNAGSSTIYTHTHSESCCLVKPTRDSDVVVSVFSLNLWLALLSPNCVIAAQSFYLLFFFLPPGPNWKVNELRIWWSLNRWKTCQGFLQLNHWRGDYYQSW